MVRSHSGKRIAPSSASDDFDEYATARGLIIGLALSQVFWIALAILIF
jgi:hypothetical protein